MYVHMYAPTTVHRGARIPLGGGEGGGRRGLAIYTCIAVLGLNVKSKMTTGELHYRSLQCVSCIYIIICVCASHRCFKYMASVATWELVYGCLRANLKIRKLQQSDSNALNGLVFSWRPVLWVSFGHQETHLRWSLVRSHTIFHEIPWCFHG